MTEEMRRVEGDAGSKHAIPQGRDRLQSRVLAGVVGTLLVGLSAYSVFVTYPSVASFAAPPVKAAGISLGFAVLVRTLRAATAGGTICGGMICFLITLWSGSFAESVLRSGLTPLILLFALTFVSTRAGRIRKARAGLAENRRGRSAAQVIANLSIAALSVSPAIAHAMSRFSGIAELAMAEMVKVMCIAALVEATADTVSSEIGQAFGGDPVLIAGLRRVKPGTDGAVTLLGSGAGIVAGVVVAIAGSWAMHLTVGAMSAALVAGVCGLFFDSVLGATVERRGWIGNDLVNFSSTAFAAMLAAVLYRSFVF
jgi:uncharacterized protein (TIGR00297 family)